MPLTRLLPFLAAILFVLAGATNAHAGQYTLTYDFGPTSDLSGWSGYVEPGYILCGHGATAGCADVSTNRILARAGSGQAIWSQGRWEWTAPPGTTIVGGALAYRTRMLHSQFFARVKMRSDGVEWDAAPTLVSEQQTTALTDHVLPLAGGFRQIGIALYAHPATVLHNFTFLPRALHFLVGSFAVTGFWMIWIAWWKERPSQKRSSAKRWIWTRQSGPTSMSKACSERSRK